MDGTVQFMAECKALHSFGWDQRKEISRPPYLRVFLTLPDAQWRMTVEGVFDVIVVGLGAMRNAAAYQLSKRIKSGAGSLYSSS
jgi:hypothetical protein